MYATSSSLTDLNLKTSDSTGSTPLARDPETLVLGSPLITAQNHHSDLMMTASDSTTENALIRHPAVNIGITALGTGENMPKETAIREEHQAK